MVDLYIALVHGFFNMKLQSISLTMFDVILRCATFWYGVLFMLCCVLLVYALPCHHILVCECYVMLYLSSGIPASYIIRWYRLVLSSIGKGSEVQRIIVAQHTAPPHAAP